MVAIKDCQKCTSCLIRYWQNTKTHLCRRCEREQDQVAGLIITAAAAAASAAEIAARVALRDARINAPRRTLATDGREFDVVWDGTTPLVWK